MLRSLSRYHSQAELLWSEHFKLCSITPEQKTEYSNNIMYVCIYDTFSS